MDLSFLLILLALLVVAVIIVGLIAVMVQRRNAETNRAHAEQLRTQAATQAPAISDSERQAEAAEAQAKLARIEAERAEQRAAEAQQGAHFEQARQEDAVREADRIDPDVDHRADGYAPSTPSMGTPVADSADPAAPAAPVHETDSATASGTHRADGSTGTI